MAVSRRSLLAAVAAVPALLAAQRALAVLGGAIAGAAAASRPAPSGTTATRCAQCGSPDHGMLDPQCPLAPRVLA